MTHKSRAYKYTHANSSVVLAPAGLLVWYQAQFSAWKIRNKKIPVNISDKYYAKIMGVEHSWG